MGKHAIPRRRGVRSWLTFTFYINNPPPAKIVRYHIVYCTYVPTFLLSSVLSVDASMLSHDTRAVVTHSRIPEASRPFMVSIQLVKSTLNEL